MAEIYTESEILETVKDVIVTALRVDRKKLRTDSRLFLDLGAESLDVLDIRFRMEEIFNIKISDGEVINRLGENLTRDEIEEKFTVQSLLEYVQYRLAEKIEV